MDKHVYDLHIRVLIYREGNDFVARALEMDLAAYGSTEKAALEELKELVECQISFARQKKDDGLLVFPAEKEYFERWEKSSQEALKKEVLDRSIKLNTKAVFLSFTKQEIQNLLRHSFERVENASCA